MPEMRQILKMTAQNVVLPFWYRLFAHGKVRDGSVLFADAHHEIRPQNMDPLFYAMHKETDWHVQEMYMDFAGASFWKTLLFSLRFMRKYARVQTVVLCDNFLPAASCKCRKETNVVQLWHACGALKKFGYDTEDDIPSTYHGHVFRNTKLVTVSSPECIAPFASAMRLDESCVQAVGVSRTDLFFRKKWQEAMREKFYRFYPQARGRHVVVAAPTFRGAAGNPEKYDLDPAMLQEALGESYFVLVSLHPHMRKSFSGQACQSAMPTSELFPVTDVLISDYSSLIYEALLFSMPLILYVPDRESYEDKRGFYHDLEEIPAFRAQSVPQLEQRIREAVRIYDDDPQRSEAELDLYRQMEIRRRAFVDRYMSSCDGHSTRRILEQIRQLRREV